MVVSQSVEIPVIDFEPFLQGDAIAQQAVADQIYHACHQVGFIYLKNVGIPKSLIQQAFQVSNNFFSLPLATKEKASWVDEFSNWGYIGMARERSDPNKPGDLKEAFNVKREIDPTTPLILPPEPELARMVRQPNHWLPDQVEFRHVSLALFDACASAAALILQSFALALQLPQHFFASYHDQQHFTLRFLHYPPLPEAIEPEHPRLGEHSDYGSVTLLFQDDIGGLEIQTTDGRWIPALPIPDTVIINTGDLMQRWTNHEFTSTRHRVQIPLDERSRRSRYSIAFFCFPNYDAEISCTISPKMAYQSPLHPPITAGKYLLSKLRASY